MVVLKNTTKGGKKFCNLFFGRAQNSSQKKTRNLKRGET
jgi:hypothetical protein